MLMLSKNKSNYINSNNTLTLEKKKIRENDYIELYCVLIDRMSILIIKTYSAAFAEVVIYRFK